MLFEEVGENVLKRLFDEIIETKYELDAGSERLKAIKNMLIFLRKYHLNLVESWERFLKEKYNITEDWLIKAEESRCLLSNYVSMNIRDFVKALLKTRQVLDYNFNESDVEDVCELLRDPVMFVIKRECNKLMEVNIGITELKDLYKALPVDCNAIPYTEYYHFYYKNLCRSYRLEDVKIYLDRVYGQEKINKRREKSEARKEKMRESRLYEKEKQRIQIIERKQKVLDLLCENNLNFYDENTYASGFIEGTTEFNEEAIINMAMGIQKEKRDKDLRRERLIEELEKYGCELRNDSYLCFRYINYNEVTLDYVVNQMRELKFLFNNTDFGKMIKDTNIFRYYDSLLGETVIRRNYNKLEESYDDIYKTYSVEKYLIARNWEFGDVQDVSPNILWRVNEVKRTWEEHNKKDGDLQRRRAEKKEKNLETYHTNKKSRSKK